MHEADCLELWPVFSVQKPNQFELLAVSITNLFIINFWLCLLQDKSLQVRHKRAYIRSHVFPITAVCDQCWGGDQDGQNDCTPEKCTLLKFFSSLESERFQAVKNLGSFESLPSGQKSAFNNGKTVAAPSNRNSQTHKSHGKDVNKWWSSRDGRITDFVVSFDDYMILWIQQICRIYHSGPWFNKCAMLLSNRWNTNDCQVPFYECLYFDSWGLILKTWKVTGSSQPPIFQEKDQIKTWFSFSVIQNCSLMLTWNRCMVKREHCGCDMLVPKMSVCSLDRLQRCTLSSNAHQIWQLYNNMALADMPVHTQ